jgi:hypothetical protein
MTRCDPLYLKIFPTPETRPRQWETLIEIYRKGKVSEAFRAFKRIYLKVVDQLIDHLKSERPRDSKARLSDPDHGLQADPSPIKPRTAPT